MKIRREFSNWMNLGMALVMLVILAAIPLARAAGSVAKESSINPSALIREDVIGSHTGGIT